MTTRLLITATFLVGCGQHSPSTTIAAPTTPTAPVADAIRVPEPAPPPPALRLPRDFVPTAYTARLAITPEAATFRGEIQIDGALAAPARVIWLDAQDLTLSAARATTADGTVHELEVLPTPKDFVGLRAPAELPAGTLKLSIQYTGLVDATNSEGIFHNKDDGRWYAFTQFEAVSARRAFPCFDEPDVKVPWQLTLEVPADDVAVSNTPIAQEQPGADAATKVVAFKRTRPLPSYLIAFAVGPFDVIDASAVRPTTSTATRPAVPIRVIVPHGRTDEAAWVVSSTGQLLDRLQDYFGTPYPYEKLDVVAIPLFGGAMENAGMITYGQAILLAKPAESTILYQRRYALIAAHEMAHQWFGDLVTTAWWDDIWLNEAFATWMEAKIVDGWKPEWAGQVDMVDAKGTVMGSDSLKTARKIHNPIATANDISTAFDGITYEKGAAVIHMFELWVGEETFRQGIRAYLAKYADHNATSAEFLAAITDTAGKDVTGPFSTFLDQVGVPMVSFELTCTKGATPTVKLSQQRYLPLGSTAEAAQLWQIPICVAYGTGATEARDCTLLSAATGELALTHAKTCPAWLLPNADELGYYRMQPKGDLLARLLDRGMKKLSLPQRVGLLDDIVALVNAGQSPAGDALALVAKLAKDSDRHIVASSVKIVASADETISPAFRPNYARFVRKVFGARARALGWKAKPGETEDTTILRASVVGFVADKGEDKVLAGEATKLAWAWLDDHKAVGSDLVPLVLGVAAARGDQKLFDRLHAEAKQAVDANERARFLGALGSFRDPELAKAAMGLMVTDEFDTREITRAILFAALGDPQTRRLAYQFVKDNADPIIAKLPRRFAAYIAFVGTTQCDASLRDEVKTFFTDRTKDLLGGPLILAQGLEQMDLCIARREAERPSVETFLKNY